MSSKLFLGFACLALLCGLAACGANLASDNKIPDDVLAALKQAESLELLSLDPVERQPEPPDTGGESKPAETKKDESRLQDWAILGSTTIKDKAQREKLVTALQKSVAENEGIAAACFNPRHGIRVKHDGKVYDIVICFECLSANTYVDNQRAKGFLLTRTPQPTFDAVLKAANVPLPKAAK